MRKLNYSFYPEPVVLLNVPEFGRFFNSTVLGNYYKQLRIRIFRRGVGSLKFLSEGYMTRLAKHYDNGNLCCYITDEELAEILGDMDIRSVEMRRKELIDLKLIRVERLGAGQYIYELGKRLRFVGNDGYDTGEESESYYLDSWVSRVSHGNLEDNSNHPETIKFRIWLTEKLAPAAKKEKILDKLRKILREVEKNFSEKEALTTSVAAAPARAKPTTRKTPIVDKVNNKKHKDTRDVSIEKMSDTLFSEAVMVDTRKEDTIKKLNETNSAEEMLALSYELSKLGVDNAEIRASLNRLTDCEFPRFPRLSVAIKFKPASEPDRDSIVRLYAALFYDVHGEFEKLGKARTVADQILEKYSVKQVVWTLREVLKKGKESDVEFLTGGIHTLKAILRNHELGYQKFIKFQQEQKEITSKTVKKEEESEIELPDYEPTEEELERMNRLLNRRKEK